ncbi:hypothetical protein CR513_26991, partial [Mucuna pruriens]
MLYGQIELCTELRWGCPPTGSFLLSSASWPTTKQENKESFSYKSWTSSAWKPMTTPGSINRKSSNFMISKLRFRWDGPFVITKVFPYGAVELKDEHTNNTFQVNGHQIKLFHEGSTPIMGDMETISLMELAQPDDTDNARFSSRFTRLSNN